jgi:pilus assembly protein CpaB
VIRGAATRRAGVWIALAGVAGLVAVVATLRAVAGPADGGHVLVARVDLPPGLLLDDEALARALASAPVPAGLDLPGLLRDPAGALDRRTAAAVRAGEPLTQASLGGAPGTGPAPLRSGERAVAMPLSAAGGAAGVLTPGAHVDVVASTGEGLAGRTAIVVGDAEVLAVAEPASRDDLGVEGEILLRVSATQALRVTAALNFAREVRLLVRPPEEPRDLGGRREVGAP